ncbi:hypothetical protein BAX99_16520 [Elizabethkingia miricola]|nr:hypothetical protein BAX99_16520 [Elizabethkingia miricola]
MEHAKKVKLSFLGVGVMDDAILKYSTIKIKNLKNWLTKENAHKPPITNIPQFTIILARL